MPREDAALNESSLIERFSPAHASHSIDYVAATLSLNDRVPPEGWREILEAALSCSRDLGLPICGDAFVTSVQGTPDQPAGGPPPTVSLSMQNAGTIFSQVGPDGRKLQSFQSSRWELKIESTVYVRWSGFLELLAPVLHRLVPLYGQSSNLAQLRLEYRDRYVDGMAKLGDPPSWDDALQAGDLLTSDHVGRPEPWHLHTGWFEKDSLNRQVLVNLHIDTQDVLADPMHIPRSIYIYSLISILQPRPVGFGAAEVISDLEGLHIRSKDLLSSVLTHRMKRRISLHAEGEK